jgi:hypothetical protein
MGANCLFSFASNPGFSGIFEIWVLIRKGERILSRLQKLIVDLRTNHNIHISYTTLARRTPLV